MRKVDEGWERWPGVTQNEAIEAVGPGWRDLAQRAWAIVTEEGGRVLQVKEKFAELRVYFDRIQQPRREHVRQQLAELREISLQTCEWCGSPGDLRDDEYYEALPADAGRTRRIWYKTLCDEHAWQFYVDHKRWWREDE